MRTRACLTFALAASILFGVGALPGSAGAEPVLCYGGSFDLPIPADADATRGWMQDAIIDVSDHHIILDLDVVVSLTHTQVFDLQLRITSPSGTTVVLNMYDPFTDYFEGADYCNTVFDDEASVSITDGEAPFEGRFRPVDAEGLSAFDGEDAFGPRGPAPGVFWGFGPGRVGGPRDRGRTVTCRPRVRGAQRDSEASF
jgi:hypothetical protein